ncbi:MAG: 1-acyl-sn-glycerol-3-phosphate acyltransferase [Opitutales bacterium]|nr:1-acyl-sn-glycerol-3-phosphate acyltransferase [Opitutales bacterium]
MAEFSNTYVTEPGKQTWLSKLMPTPFFYMDMANLVCSSGLFAKWHDYNDERWLADSFKALRVLERSGVQIHVENIDVVRNLEGPVVYIGNHMSTLETFLLPAFIRSFQPVTYVIKQSLVEYPIFKHVMRSRNPIVVGRDNPKADLIKVMKEGQERIASGISVIVFPQTTRALTFDRSQFNSIGVKLAKKAGVKVVPLALKTDAWSPGKWHKDYGPIYADRPVHVRFGQAMEVVGSGKETHEAIGDFIEQSLAEWTL